MNGQSHLQTKIANILCTMAMTCIRKVAWSQQELAILALFHIKK